MSFVDRNQDPRRRANAIIAVGVIHAGLAYVVVTGLGAEIVNQLRPPQIIGEQIPLPPPPPSPDPTPPKPSDPKDTTIEVPRPPIPFPPPPSPGPEVDWDETPGPIGDPFPGPPQPPLPPSPASPSFTPKGARPSNNSAGWISTNDYPRGPLMNEIEGTVGYRLVIGTNGRVGGCELTRPSGNRALDDATCRLLTSRARFEPATDESGAKVLGTYTGSVRWEIPD